MKKLTFAIVSLLIVLGVRHDLSNGSVQIQEKDSLPTVTAPYQEVIIQPGQTILSVVERLHDQPVSVPIEKIVDDFHQLNGMKQTETLQIGQTYRFPLYNTD
ncbi:hypothetical protein [Shouchella lonarensis]|uniref:LysM domain-containing protein n=1 Tax=Shouchella lonarensis TaxID=1464122 RepID=A0A1G6KMX1_9BACI|nr:hypothetical protein [Shouchella lonarensis]SDC32400.1 hypothetical protein SAMN05421737_10788 [Shouchella lonarensis]